MNLNLNVQQIVLLCLLVAFVTSITTGITVVSLTDQTDTPVSQTINRVVERTIERVVEPQQEDTKKENVTVTKTPERIIETVVVNQEDLTVEAVQKNSRSLVRIHLLNRGTTGEFVTLGVAVSGNSIVVDRNLINKKGEYVAKTKAGDLPVDILSYDESQNFVVLQLKDGKDGLSPAQFIDSNSLQLAQSIISISGSSENSISTGVINKLDSFEKTEGENTWTEVTKIYAGVNQDNILVGSILVNLQGNILGFKNYDPNAQKNIFTPSNVVKSFLSARGI